MNTNHSPAIPVEPWMTSAAQEITAQPRYISHECVPFFAVRDFAAIINRHAPIGTRTPSSRDDSLCALRAAIQRYVRRTNIIMHRHGVDSVPLDCRESKMAEEILAVVAPFAANEALVKAAKHVAAEITGQLTPNGHLGKEFYTTRVYWAQLAGVLRAAAGVVNADDNQTDKETK